MRGWAESSISGGCALQGVRGKGKDDEMNRVCSTQYAIRSSHAQLVEVCFGQVFDAAMSHAMLFACPPLLRMSSDEIVIYVGCGSGLSVAIRRVLNKLRPTKKKMGKHSRTKRVIYRTKCQGRCRAVSWFLRVSPRRWSKCQGRSRNVAAWYRSVNLCLISWDCNRRSLKNPLKNIAEEPSSVIFPIYYLRAQNSLCVYLLPSLSDKGSWTCPGSCPGSSYTHDQFLSNVPRRLA
jgi:hypothetical protein